MSDHGPIWEKINVIEGRVRRVEYVLVALVVATASPKLDGPTVPQIVTGAVHALGTLGSIVTGAAAATGAAAWHILTRN